MTDLSKGIIEIDGFEINSNTTSLDIQNNLKNAYAHCATSTDGSCYLFRFDSVSLLNKCFKIKITVINKKINNIQLFSLHGEDEHLSYEQRFESDCEWLKDILGEPTRTGGNGVIYEFDSVHVGATNFECDGRRGPEEFIQISY